MTYHDVNGNEVLLPVLCARDPGWAANRITVLLAEVGKATANVDAARASGIGEAYAFLRSRGWHGAADELDKFFDMPVADE